MGSDTVFICHATPEDNDFVRWLGTRLTGHGYKVWADLFGLKGGSPFWITIEDALRQNACKVIFVVSKTSVDPTRSGVRNELSVADSIKKKRNDPSFIIPVRIDSTEFSDFPILIHQLNAIDFSKGWGPKLSELLDTLDNDAVPKAASDQIAEFDRWRESYTRNSAIVEELPEPVLTNLLPIISFPRNITFYEHNEDVAKVISALKEAGIPSAQFLRLTMSFSQLSEFAGLSLNVRARVPFADFLEGDLKEVTAPKRDEAKKTATFLLRRHIEDYLQTRGLKKFESSAAPSFYFPLDLVENNKVPYFAASGRKTSKNVVGRSERNKVYWHLAMKVNVSLGPPALVRFKPYVCFSEDGRVAITDPKKTTPIRRRFCKNWWNEQWRQLQVAFCVFLADGNESIEIKLSGEEKLVLSSNLLELVADRKMPDDFNFVEEADEPDEPEDDPDDGPYDEPDDPPYVGETLQGDDTEDAR